MDRTVLASLEALIASSLNLEERSPWADPPWMSSPEGSTFLGSITASEDLVLFDDYMLQALGNGASAISRKALAVWLVERAVLTDSTSAVADVDRYVHEEKFQAYHIMLLDGLDVDSEHDLGNGVRIIPWDRLPNQGLLRAAWTQYLVPLPMPRISSVLISPFQHPRSHTSQAESAAGKTNRPDVPTSPLSDAALCLVIARGGGFGFQPIASSIVASDEVPIVGGGFNWNLHTHRSSNFSAPLIEIEASMAKATHEKFVKLGDSERGRLAVPLRKLRDFASTFDRSEGAVDLRTALESLFLNENQTQELGYRLSLRAALFTGGDLAERKRVSDVVKDAYKLGSSAVHNGRLSDRQLETAKKKLEQAAEVVRLAVMKMLDQPEVDWEVIELGDD